MSNFATRILFVGAAIPALFALATYVPFMDHLPLAILVLAFAAGSGVELRRIVEPSAAKPRTVLAALFAALPSAVVYAVRQARPEAGLAASWLAPVAGVSIGLFLISALPIALPRKADNVRASVAIATANAFYLLYPGALASTIIVILGSTAESGLLLIWFATVVFGNDSLAWLAGVTLGHKRGIFTVSPNKSLEGLLAGMAGSVGFAFLGPVLLPGIVPRSWPTLLALGLACGVAVVAGDLFESAIKRSAGVKDSGSIVPGRGGILDSFDSLLFAAPVFIGVLAAAGVAL